jgi:hypothetical protein
MNEGYLPEWIAVSLRRLSPTNLLPTDRFQLEKKLGGRPAPSTDKEVDIGAYNKMSKALAAQWPKMEDLLEVGMHGHSAKFNEAKSSPLYVQS